MSIKRLPWKSINNMEKIITIYCCIKKDFKIVVQYGPKFIPPLPHLHTPRKYVHVCAYVCLSVYIMMKNKNKT